MNAWVNIVTDKEILSINMNNVTRMRFDKDSKLVYVTLIAGPEMVYSELTELMYKRIVGA